jgi:hypothetical protein
MKLILIFLGVILSISTMAQDVITLQTGVDVKAKVLEVSDNVVKYKKFDHQTGPTYSINTTKLLMIRYENGSKDIFNTDYNESLEKVGEKSILQKTNIDYYRLGGQHAQTYFKAPTLDMSGIAAVGCLLSPLFSLPFAIIYSAKGMKLRPKHLAGPDHSLFEIPDYYNGYNAVAQEKVKSSAWAWWGGSALIWVIAVLALSAGG